MEEERTAVPAEFPAPTVPFDTWFQYAFIFSPQTIDGTAQTRIDIYINGVHSRGGLKPVLVNEILNGTYFMVSIAQGS